MTQHVQTLNEYVCMHVCMYVGKLSWLETCQHVDAEVYNHGSCTYVCMYVRMYILMRHVNVLMLRYVIMHVCTYVCMYVCTLFLHGLEMRFDTEACIHVCMYI